MNSNECRLVQCYQHSFFRMLCCIGDPKKVENEVQGATEGVEGNPWLNVDLNDKFIMGDSFSLHGYKKGWSNAITHIATTLANKTLVNILC